MDKKEEIVKRRYEIGQYTSGMYFATIFDDDGCVVRSTLCPTMAEAQKYLEEKLELRKGSKNG